MITAKTLSGAVLATAAAGMFAMAPVTNAVAAGHEPAPCFGVNSCKGTGACKTAKNACKGLNSCKGQGFVLLTKKDCDDQGGSTVAPE